MKAFKELWQLHDDLSFYIYAMNWRKACFVCKMIAAYKDTNPIAWFIAWALDWR